MAGTGLLGVGAGVALGESPASADVPASQRFDLSQPSYERFRGVSLHETHHAMQGMAYDNVNRRLYIAQIQNGSDGDDLCVNQLSISGGLTGHMHVSNAGHGVSIGVEPVGTASYIWMECDSDQHSDAGRGTALARFKFVNGGTPSSVKKFLTGSKTISCATDPVNKRLLVRRSESGGMHYSLFSLADAAAGKFSSPLAHFAQPTLGNGSVTFQGYTFLDNYLYTLDGTGHEDPADINSYVTATDMNTGKVVQRSFTAAGKTLFYREPEGMMVYRTVNDNPRLCFGFASRPSMTSSSRYASVYYKYVLI
ncbi:teichoic acid biosynthesis protein C [Streptomyces sp. NPDC008139]|uniref:phage baseplate protein n=1 Tax=Streptomyces sp. NPDC008139 TaxID=3364814 RepID=UPI0036DFDAF9